MFEKDHEVRFYYRKTGDVKPSRLIVKRASTPAPHDTDEITDLILRCEETYLDVVLQDEYAEPPGLEALTRALREKLADIEVEENTRKWEERERKVTAIRKFIESRGEEYFFILRIERRSTVDAGGKRYFHFESIPEDVRALSQDLGLLEKLDEVVRWNHENFDEIEKWHEENQRRADAERKKREEELEKLNKKTLEDAKRWIAEGSSRRLHLLLEQGYEWSGAYARERMLDEFDALGVRVLDYEKDVEGEFKKVEEPGLESLLLLSELKERLKKNGSAEKVSSLQVVFLPDDPENEGEHLFFEYFPHWPSKRFSSRGLIAVESFGASMEESAPKEE